ncbi:MAG: efflux RND transporter periplasmic adaptor subunit [Thermodesulfobacteriota bacterium]|nr:efflux RND transporter periplasmic adaptor subunit [Thermodesulfobacteriota bacterium]
MIAWKSKKYGWFSGLVGVVALVLLAGWLRSTPVGDEQAQTALLVTVESIPLAITVNAAGSLKAKEQVVIVNTLEGMTTVLSVVDEGSEVKKGDLLIELDVSTLQSKLIDQQIRVQNAQASYVQARENLEVVNSQSQSDVADARLAQQFAQDDLHKYRQGEFPNQKQAELANIAVDEEELRRAEEKLSWSKVLFEEKFLSQTELQADELAAQKARIDLNLSRSNLALLLDFTHKRQLTELQAEVNKTNMALERNKRKAEANKVQAQADSKAKEALLERETAKLEKVREEIAKTVIVAPQDGVVVYATSLKRSWRGSAEPLAAGQQVRERQELIYLPAPGAMLAETQIHESNLDKVEVGQPAQVYVDSIGGRSFKARVRSLAIFPDATSSWLNPDLKLYRTQLELQEHFDGLRSGMNCRIEIAVAHFEHTLAIPIQAVVVVDDTSFVYRLKSGELSRQAVELGLSNESMVQILSGLHAGDKIQLNPPLAETSL